MFGEAFADATLLYYGLVSLGCGLGLMCWGLIRRNSDGRRFGALSIWLGLMAFGGRAVLAFNRDVQNLTVDTVDSYANDLLATPGAGTLATMFPLLAGVALAVCLVWIFRPAK